LEGTVPTLQSLAILTELRELKDLLELHGLEMQSLRAALATQFKRIAQMQAELDLQPAARKRREAVLWSAKPSQGGGNGHSHR
jgi:hypothetical protein